MARDFDIVLLTADDIHDRLLPSGHLREPLSSLQRADAIVLSGGASPENIPLNNKLVPTLSRIEREMIKVALHEHRGKVDAAARALGISRKGLYLKRQRLGL